jgi:hypothetical protein
MVIRLETTSEVDKLIKGVEEVKIDVNISTRAKCLGEEDGES